MTVPVTTNKRKLFDSNQITMQFGTSKDYKKKKTSGGQSKNSKGWNFKGQNINQHTLSSNINNNINIPLHELLQDW